MLHVMHMLANVELMKLNETVCVCERMNVSVKYILDGLNLKTSSEK